MSIERNLRLALHQLVEAIEYTPMGVRGIKAMANARKALEAAQQPATALACGIPGITKTTCPYCEQGFAFEHEQPVKGEPVGYMNEGHIHELAMGRIPYGYVYPEAGAGASTAVYTHPAPSVPATTEPVAWSEREQLRHAQAAVVMPMIGPLLDAWENSDREVMSQEPELSKQLKNINSAMEDADTHPAPSVPATPSLQAVCRYISDVLGSEAPNGEKHIARTIMHLLPLEQSLSGQQPAMGEPVLFIHPDTFAMNNAQVGAWKPGYELTSYIPLYTHPAPSVPDGLQWFTVAEHGLPEVGEAVAGGLWYTDPWLKPEHATYFMWGQCRVVDTKHRDFKDGKQWLTFGPSHNQITHWARLNPPAMLAAKKETP